MEAIKCPNCGSEKVQELTEEKYVCLACDNVFLIHNLSKEFRQTDAHILEMHQDLKEELKGLKNGKESENNTLLAEGEGALLDEDEIKAYETFRRYALLNPESSKGYIGMFRAVTHDFDGTYIASSVENYGELDALYDGFDVLKKALECEDCNYEELLSQSLSYYKNAANEAFIKIAMYHIEYDEEGNVEFDTAREWYEKLIEVNKEELDELLEKQKEYDAANILTRKLKGLEKPDDGNVALCKGDIEWYQKILDDDITKFENMTVEGLKQIIYDVVEDNKCDAAETIHQANRKYYESAENLNGYQPTKVWVEATGANKVQVIKLVRDITGLGLKEAKDMVDNAPFFIEADEEDLPNIKATFDEVGATTRIE